MSANERQEGGCHYGGGEYQHWDFAWEHHYNQFEYCISNYVLRHKDKGGLVDLKKAQHHLDKYIELAGPRVTVLPERSGEDCTRILTKYKANVSMAAIVELVHMGLLDLAHSCLYLLIAKVEKKQKEAGARPRYVDQ